MSGSVEMTAPAVKNAEWLRIVLSIGGSDPSSAAGS
jgi:hypothetical protein